MRIRTSLLLSLFIYFSAFNSHAEDASKNINIGFGAYALVVAYADPFILDDEFTGTTFTVSYAFSNNMAVRGNLYAIEHDDLSIFEASGTDIVLLFSSGLENIGFKAYLGGGIFNEEMDFFGGFTQSFNGLQLNAGIGYSWDFLALDLIVGLRDSSDYTDFVGSDSAAASSSLTLSARF